jgi:hypothetical protein
MFFAVTLQTVFYVVGIVYMVVGLIVLLGILSAVLVIKAKINKVHDAVDQKINQVKNVSAQASLILSTIRRFVKR